MARSLAIPVYEVVERSGPDHAPVFRIAARVEGIEPGYGEGASKRVAEQEAARLTLRVLPLFLRGAVFVSLVFRLVLRHPIRPSATESDV
jgi:hypothetical protein